MSLLEKKKDFTRQPSFDKRQYLVEFRLWGRVKSDQSSGDLIEIETNPATAKCMIGQTHISRGLPIFCLTLSAGEQCFCASDGYVPNASVWHTFLPSFPQMRCLTGRSLGSPTPNELMMRYTTETRGKKTFPRSLRFHGLGTPCESIIGHNATTFRTLFSPEMKYLHSLGFVDDIKRKVTSYPRPGSVDEMNA